MKSSQSNDKIAGNPRCLLENNSDEISPLFGYNSTDYISKLKQIESAEKTKMAVGLILDVPVPSDNDAFSEYSTFVNNIFSKLV